jgi:hypothetical protein
MQSFITPVFAFLAFETPLMLCGLVIMAGLAHLAIGKR